MTDEIARGDCKKGDGTDCNGIEKDYANNHIPHTWDGGGHVRRISFSVRDIAVHVGAYCWTRRNL